MKITLSMVATFEVTIEADPNLALSEIMDHSCKRLRDDLHYVLNSADGQLEAQIQLVKVAGVKL